MYRELLSKHAPELLLPPREGDNAGWVTPGAQAGIEPPEALYDEATGMPLNTYREGDGPTHFFVPQGATPTATRPVAGLQGRYDAVQPATSEPNNLMEANPGPPRYNVPQIVAGEHRPIVVPIPPATSAPPSPTAGPTYTPPADLELPPETGAPPELPEPEAGDTLAGFFGSLGIQWNIPGSAGSQGARSARPVGEPIDASGKARPAPEPAAPPTPPTPTSLKGRASEIGGFLEQSGFVVNSTVRKNNAGGEHPVGDAIDIAAFSQEGVDRAVELINQTYGVQVSGIFLRGGTKNANGTVNTGDHGHISLGRPARR